MRPNKSTSTPPTTPTLPTAPAELLRVGQEYAEVFNASSIDEIDRLIADACVDPFWDDRTNLLSLLAEDPEDLGLVLATDPEEYVVVRYVDDAGGGGGHWMVDTEPVDWDELEDRAFDPAFDPGADDDD